MTRIDLYVSPEEYAAVQLRGACWDARAKCWYLESRMDPKPFRRWLDTAAAAGERYTIRSRSAYVARAWWRCERCRAPMQVVCIYCRRGSACGERLEHFSVHHLHGPDERLARQLSRWREYRPGGAAHDAYLNHCPRCSWPCEDERLHSEPEQPLFDLRGVVRVAVELTALQGLIRLCGDISVDV